MYGVQTDRQTVCGSVLSAVLRADDSAGVLRGGEAHRSLPAQRGAALSHELRCCRVYCTPAPLHLSTAAARARTRTDCTRLPISSW